MDSGNPYPRTEPTLPHTLREDLRQGNFWETLRRDFIELKEFSLDSEKRARLAQKSPLARGFAVVWGILRQMILKLTPARRLLVVVGLLFPIIGGSSQGNRLTFQAPIGTGLILFVLLLELKDRLLSQDELHGGRAVQKALLPEQTPDVPGWSLWLSTSAANEVGGDLVDFLSVTPERKGLVIADVSGKGLRAALLMAKLQTIVRTLAPDYTSISGFIARVNDTFRRECPPNIFASMIYLEIAPGQRQVQFVNAGHLPPIHVGPNGVHELEKGEAALGLIRQTSYVEHTITIDPGDLLLCYSDGLTEACNESGEFFGGDRLLKLLQSLRSLSAPAIGEGIMAEISRFVGNAHPHDDLSLLVLKGC